MRQLIFACGLCTNEVVDSKVGCNRTAHLFTHIPCVIKTTEPCTSHSIPRAQTHQMLACDWLVLVRCGVITDVPKRVIVAQNVASLLYDAIIGRQRRGVYLTIRNFKDGTQPGLIFTVARSLACLGCVEICTAIALREYISIPSFICCAASDKAFASRGGPRVGCFVSTYTQFGRTSVRNHTFLHGRRHGRQEAVLRVPILYRRCAPVVLARKSLQPYGSAIHAACRDALGP